MAGRFSPILGRTLPFVTGVGLLVGGVNSELVPDSVVSSIRDRLPDSLAERLEDFGARLRTTTTAVASASSSIIVETSEEKERQPQRGVITGTRDHALFLVLKLRAKADPSAVLQAASATLHARTIKPEHDVDVVLGLGHRSWSWVRDQAPGGAAVDPEDFQQSNRPTKTNGPSIPATGGDLVLHLKCDMEGDCVDVARAFLGRMNKDAITSVVEERGFGRESRCSGGRNQQEYFGFDLQTSKPSSIAERRSLSTSPTSGGSFLLLQRWTYDKLAAFDNLPPAEKSRVSGRTYGEDKSDYACPRESFDLTQNPASITMAIKSGALSPNAHVSRVLGLDPDSRRLGILRQSMPCGAVGVREGDAGYLGLLFVGYSPEPGRLNWMMDRIVGTKGAGKDSHDALLAFANCRSSQLFYVPSEEQLHVLATARRKNM